MRVMGVMGGKGDARLRCTMLQTGPFPTSWQHCEVVVVDKMEVVVVLVGKVGLLVMVIGVMLVVRGEEREGKNERLGWLG